MEVHIVTYMQTMNYFPATLEQFTVLLVHLRPVGMKCFVLWCCMEEEPPAERDDGQSLSEGRDNAAQPVRPFYEEQNLPRRIKTITEQQFQEK